MVQLAFLYLVALVNFSAGVGAAVYLGRAPRDLRFLAPLLDAILRHPLLDRSAHAAPDMIASPVVAAEVNALLTSAPEANPEANPDPNPTGLPDSEPAAARRANAETAQEPVATDDTSPNCPPVQLSLEEAIIDMAAQEEHLRQLGQRASASTHEGSSWEELLSDVNEDIQTLLKQFNGARHLVEQATESAAEAGQVCLGQLDMHWNAINQQSMQLLMMSAEPDPPESARHQLAAICEGVLVACLDTRQSCAAFLAHALLAEASEEGALVSP